ncbi:DUF58 domain-containing protein [Planococcus versutus]|uniref:DUF58 domain-containing protein n=1 Tax=Planococcus versutus TaxID=1302659 RepID=A0A1B1RYU5_9BACL|nr:DUF58 domain-containing protein [Planococcus versutus]ANU26099.1 hypothetical protein I858_003510 [Planococcus versutus]
MSESKKSIASWGRLILVLFILFLTFSFAMFQGGFVSWFIFYMSLPFIVYSILLSFYPMQDIRAHREIHTTQIRKGGSFSATAIIHRKIPFPLLYTVLSEQTHSSSLNKKIESQGSKMIVPGFRKSYSWTYVIDEMPRGEHVLEGIHLETADFFGWVKKIQLLPVQQTVLVYPNTVEITYRPMESRYDHGSMAAPFTLVKDTTMTSGLRDYQPGDRVSWIHWKSYARTQTLRTKEFEDRQSQDLFLLDDRNDTEKFELQVELVASILKAVVQANSSLAYLSVGRNRNYFPLVQTEAHLQRVMYHLAKVQSDLDKPVVQAIGRELQQMNTSSLLYVTSQLSMEMIESIRKNAKNLSNCMCLVVANKGEIILEKDENVHQYARSKGFVVKRVSPENFATVFTEVSR